MNGLRVYINSAGMSSFEEDRVFYSRRADGPYYHWRYEERLGQWHCSRLHPSELMPKALCVASWKAVPTGLKAMLIEHYLD
jgi:hypothetical protein